MPIFKPKNFNNSWAKEMKLLSDIIFNAPAFEKFDEFENYLSNLSGLSGEKLYKPLKLLLTNSEESPELSLIYPLIKSYILEVTS
jgi:glutamyl-tRNA synthetase